MQMQDENFSVIYSGNIVQVDFIKSVLEGSGIQCVLQDEYLGRMRPYAVPGGIKVLVPNADVDKARRIVEDFIKDSTA
ncbi:MAG: hypothetical protein DMG17_15840 [Acidobacteria bacterium]|nr:MAG: hypothetical protein AUF79_05740 [Crenarchaeota archaeon 13_1_20CM_2_51_8]PYS15029.1 MAG: hypothetical protein DMG17_15840 [Acidobacteriota bacterium]